MDKILILDFGGQTTQLIARRIRETGIYTEIVPGDTDFQDGISKEVKGIILSGSPESVYDPEAPAPDKRIFQFNVPILGICYGFHQTVLHFGGNVKSHQKREYGRSPVRIARRSALFSGVPDGFVSWMSHGDSVSALPDNFDAVAQSEDFIASACSRDLPIYGTQFHPEVTHCDYGTKILENFAVGICGAKTEWSMNTYLEQAKAEVRGTVGDKSVIVLISGGVDSTVVAALLLQCLESSQVHLMYVDTGLMRKNETAEVGASLKSLGAENINIIDASEKFLNVLEGVENPEQKRKLIGDMFIYIQELENSDRLITEAYLAQGTLYTDMIESGKGVGKKAHVIKSHHNVRSPLVEEKREAGLLIEPLSLLYKDEVRALGRILGVSEHVLSRHPFPGPGLAVRILGEVTKEKCNILREADAIFIDELFARNLYHEIWQAFCVLLPIRSVGVTGDARNYGYVLSLRAIISRDGMTADVFPFEMRDLLEISAIITNKVPEVGRVVYDISSKPPATIEWE
ncbi:MAG: glutamine-hydrolyzing GMP synthase [Spirochaetales bacterium]|nr:glutamine-hydrolyzing GMP synthase [Spirochaetales bacterium]